MQAQRIGAEDGQVFFLDNPYTVTRTHPALILDFFVALAEHAGAPDEACLSACTLNAQNLAALPAKTRYSAMQKLLASPSPRPALTAMAKAKVLKYALGFPAEDFSLLENLEIIEALRKKPSPWPVRLLALLLRAPLPPEKAIAHLASFWRPEKEDVAHWTKLLDYSIAADPALPAKDKNILIKQTGKSTYRELLLLRWALEEDVKAAAKAYKAALK